MRQPQLQKIKSHKSFAHFITATTAQRQSNQQHVRRPRGGCSGTTLGGRKQDVIEGFRVEKLCRAIALRISLIEVRCRELRTLQAITAEQAHIPTAAPAAVAQNVVQTVVGDMGHKLARVGKKLLCLRCGKKHGQYLPER